MWPLAGSTGASAEPSDRLGQLPPARDPVLVGVPSSRILISRKICESHMTCGSRAISEFCGCLGAPRRPVEGMLYCRFVLLREIARSMVQKDCVLVDIQQNLTT